jgi:hypothetical protein
VFEDCFRTRKANGRTRFEKFLPLTISVILHAFLVYGLYHARFPIKFLKTRPTVRNIVIGPPLTSYLPKVVGPNRPGGPAKGAAPEGGPEAGTGSRRAAARPESRPAAPAPSGQPGAGVQTFAVPALSAKFQQSLASRLKTGEESELKIVLGPPGSKPGPAAPPSKGPVTDFYKYIPGSVRGAGAAP